MNLKKMSCCMLAVGMIASMNLASFADSTVQAEAPLSVEQQSASAEQDVKASAYYIDENGNEVPMEVETTVRSLGKTLTRSGEEVENFEVTAKASTYKNSGDSTIINQGSLFCEATATVYYTSSISLSGRTVNVYAESGTWDYGNKCYVVGKYFSLTGGNKQPKVYIPDSQDGFYEQTTYVANQSATYRTHGIVKDSSNSDISKEIIVQIVA